MRYEILDMRLQSLKLKAESGKLGLSFLQRNSPLTTHHSPLTT